jgi:Trk K+ transport system NAD-binding subunit
VVALGVSVGHLQPEIISIMTAVGIITIAGSTYAMNYSDKLYEKLSDVLNLFERKGIKIDETSYSQEKEYEAILFGYNRIGFDLLKAFKKINKKVLVVDYNPDTISELTGQRTDCKYGDAGDSELLDELNFSNVKMVISTIPEMSTNLVLLKHLKKTKNKKIFVAVSHQLDEAKRLYKEGATYVVMPHFLGGHHTSHLIKTHGLSLEKFEEEKQQHLKMIEERKEKGHEHPRHERYHNKS